MPKIQIFLLKYDMDDAKRISSPKSSSSKKIEKSSSFSQKIEKSPFADVPLAPCFSGWGGAQIHLQDFYPKKILLEQNVSF